MMKNSERLTYDIRRYGEPTNPVIVSIIGTGKSMNWMNTIVEGLAQRGFYVINYNPRDACGTTAYKECAAAVPEDKQAALMEGVMALFNEDGTMNPDADVYIPYTWWDMADDLAAVLDKEGLTNRKVSIIGFSTAGTICQVMMTRLKDRLNSAIICASTYEKVPSQEHFQRPELQELMAVEATLTPETPKEERVEKSLPMLKATFEIDDNERETIMKKCIEDDVENGWIDTTGGMNPYSILAWAHWAKNHEEHKAQLKDNQVPCLVVAGRKDPIISYQQSEMLAANCGCATLHMHDHGHILGPASAAAATLDTIAEFVKNNSGKR